MWTNINRVYATPHPMNAWGNLDGLGWRKVKPIAPDGVTNTFLLLALAKATDRKAYVVTDSTNMITAVYL